MLGIFCACKYRKGWLELTWGWLVLKVAEVGIGIRDTIGTTETAVTRYMKALRCYLLRVTLTARPSHVQKLGATARSKRVMNSVKRTAVMTQSQTECSLPPPDVSRYTHTQITHRRVPHAVLFMRWWHSRTQHHVFSDLTHACSDAGRATGTDFV